MSARQAWWPLAALVAGCAAPSAISPGYDVSRVRKIGVLRAEAGCPELKGIEGLLTRRLVEFGFSVVERADIDRVLAEQRLSVSGAVTPEGARRLGKVLGVDALAIAQAGSCQAERKQIVMVRTQTHHEEPILRKSPEKRKDGSVVEVEKIVGTRTRTVDSEDPHVVTLDAVVGLVARLVDAETGEVIWAGSYTNEGINAHAAADAGMYELIKSLRRQWDAAAKRRKSAG